MIQRAETAFLNAYRKSVHGLSGLENQDLLDLFEVTCVDPEIKGERWGAVVVSKSGGTHETAAAYRVLMAAGWPLIDSG